MKKFICTTTINHPTEALIKYAEMNDWTLIVAGDVNTPHDSYKKLNNTLYLHPKYQNSKYKKLSDLIGWQTIERRNFATLEAYERGADIIALVDDDNIPLSNWGDIKVNCAISVDVYNSSYENINVFDPFSVTNFNHLWHRGFPIQLLKSRKTKCYTTNIIPDIQANFWNGEPDVDALARIEYGKFDCKFDDSVFPFSTDNLCPFNSQNTILSRRVIKDYFLFTGIGRMSDIWAAYYTIAKGYKIIYDSPSVYQKRNEHDIVRDLSNELLGYKESNNLIEDLSTKNNIDDVIKNYLPENSMEAFYEYKNIIAKIGE